MCVADRDRRIVAKSAPVQGLSQRLSGHTETPNIDSCPILCKVVHCNTGLARSSLYNFICNVVIPLLFMTLLLRLVAMLLLLPLQARDADLIPQSMIFVCPALLRESLHTSSWKPSC